MMSSLTIPLENRLKAQQRNNNQDYTAATINGSSKIFLSIQILAEKHLVWGLCKKTDSRRVSPPSTPVNRWPRKEALKLQPKENSPTWQNKTLIVKWLWLELMPEIDQVSSHNLQGHFVLTKGNHKNQETFFSKYLVLYNRNTSSPAPFGGFPGHSHLRFVSPRSWLHVLPDNST